MKPDSPTLRLFGVIHVDRPSKVREELAAYANETDALFIEQPESDVTLGTFARSFAKTPLFFLGSLVHLVLLTPMYIVCQRSPEEAEAIAVRRVADRQGLQVHEIDDHPVLYMSRAGPRWILVNWATLAGLAWIALIPFLLVFFSVMIATSLIFMVVGYRRLWLVCGLPFSWGALWYAGIWNLPSIGILAGFYLFYLVSVLRIHPHRNEHMLRRVGDVSERQGYEKTCLVTGKAHLTGLVRLASGFDLSVSRVHTSKWLRTSNDVVENPNPEAATSNVALPWILDSLR